MKINILIVFLCTLSTKLKLITKVWNAFFDGAFLMYTYVLKCIFFEGAIWRALMFWNVFFEGATYLEFVAAE